MHRIPPKMEPHCLHKVQKVATMISITKISFIIVFLLTFNVQASAMGKTAGNDFEQQRKQMVERQLRGRDITDSNVLTAMSKVPRHLFVPPEIRQYSYEDSPLPIGYEQTISQPYIVALMSQLLSLKPGRKCWRSDRLRIPGGCSG